MGLYAANTIGDGNCLFRCVLSLHQAQILWFGRGLTHKRSRPKIAVRFSNFTERSQTNFMDTRTITRNCDTRSVFRLFLGHVACTDLGGEACCHAHLALAISLGLRILGGLA